jgi:hypothetical protein
MFLGSRVRPVRRASCVTGLPVATLSLLENSTHRTGLSSPASQYNTQGSCHYLVQFCGTQGNLVQFCGCWAKFPCVPIQYTRFLPLLELCLIKHDAVERYEGVEVELHRVKCQDEDQNCGYYVALRTNTKTKTYFSLQRGLKHPGVGEDSTRHVDQNETQEPFEPFNRIWSSHSRRFVPEMRCWHARNKLNHLFNRSETHNWYNISSYNFALLNYLCSCINFYIKNSVASVRKRTIPTEQQPLVSEVIANFSADRGCHVVSVTNPYGRILGFLDQSRYYFFQVALQLYSRGWVDPVPDPLFFFL